METYLKAPTFTQWLYSVRTGPYASLAHFAFADRVDCWPNKARRMISFIRHVQSKHREAKAPSERLIRLAWAAFEHDMIAGVRVLARRERSAAADRRRTPHCYSVSATTDARLLAIAREIGVESRGRAIDMLVERYSR